MDLYRFRWLFLIITALLLVFVCILSFTTWIGWFLSESDLVFLAPVTEKIGPGIESLLTRSKALFDAVGLGYEPLYDIVQSFLVFLISVFLTLFSWKPDIFSRGVNANSMAERLYQRSRRLILQEMNTFWIESVLNRSLFEQTLIDLDVENVSGTLGLNPWSDIAWSDSDDEGFAPTAASIDDLFRLMNYELLILGPPGSGKTTALLSVAKHKIEEAQLDENASIPVILHLSSWSHDQTFGEWLVGELKSRYRIPEDIAMSWVEYDELILFLDGLNEIEPTHREFCIDSINEFRKGHSINMVVCSRIDDYLVLNKRLGLQGVIVLKQLSTNKIFDYFQNLGVEYRKVWQAINQDANLTEMARSPLMLSTIIRTFRNISSEELNPATSNSTDPKEYLFQNYIDQMLRRYGTKTKSPSRENTLRWLSWLAVWQKRDGNRIFLIEDLQPSCLDEKRKIPGSSIFCGWS